MARLRILNRERRRREAPIKRDIELCFNLGKAMQFSPPNRGISYMRGGVGQCGPNCEGLRKYAAYANNDRAMIDKWHRLFDHNDY